MRIAILSGSSREDNNTLRLALCIKHLCEGDRVDIVDFRDYDLPFAREEIDPDNLTAFQQSLVNAMHSAELVFILTPEYNWFPSAELVNMIHQLANRSFKYLFDHKVFAFAGVSTGKGGRMPAVQLSYVFDKIISYFGTSAITSSKKFESHFTQGSIDEEGVIHNDEGFEKAITRFIRYNKELASRWNP